MFIDGAVEFSSLGVTLEGSTDSHLMPGAAADAQPVPPDDSKGRPCRLREADTSLRSRR